MSLTAVHLKEIQRQQTALELWTPRLAAVHRGRHSFQLLAVLAFAHDEYVFDGRHVAPMSPDQAA